MTKACVRALGTQNLRTVFFTAFPWACCRFDSGGSGKYFSTSLFSTARGALTNLTTESNLRMEQTARSLPSVSTIAIVHTGPNIFDCLWCRGWRPYRRRRAPGHPAWLLRRSQTPLPKMRIVYSLLASPAAQCFCPPLSWLQVLERRSTRRRAVWPVEQQVSSR